MPSPEVERRLEEIKAKQRKRGVIEPLVGRHWPEEGVEQKERLRLARRLRDHLRRSNEQRFHYLLAGDHYDLPNGRIHLFFPEFQSTIQKKLRKAKRKKTKIKWLDIGPGYPEYFMPYFEKIDRTGRTINLHTLSPDQILPKHFGLKDTETKISNHQYNRLKSRLTHHVGAIETYNQNKLGKFDVIVSISGGLRHSEHPIEALTKVAQLLKRKGKAYLHLSSYIEDERFDVRRLQPLIGSDFKIETPTHLSPNKFTAYVITRLK